MNRKIEEETRTRGSKKYQSLAIKVRDAIRQGNWEDADVAFAQLQNDSTPSLMAHAQRKVSKEDAEDIVSDIHLVLYNYLTKTEQIADIQGWMFAVLKNKIADFYRSYGNNKTDTQPPEFWEQRSECESVTEDPSQIAIRRQQNKVANELLDALGSEDPVLREIIEARIFDDESIADTISRMQITRDQFNYRLSKAIKRLRILAKKRGLDDEL
jgi:RNA polymerase sigma factor (sigma-70 family)